MVQNDLYTPLADRQIRLVSLRWSHDDYGKPAYPARDGRVDCKMKIYSLDTCPVYTALSYTWGLEDAQKFNLKDVKRPIRVNGQETMVQQNLALFLDQVRPDSALLQRETSGGSTDFDTDDDFAPDRLSQEVGYLWIDALCINQNDVAEKSKQVALMREIYAQASRIAIWLGPGDDDSDLAISIYQRLDSEPVRSNAFHTISAPEKNAVMSFHQRPWWERVWVWQEATTPEVECELWCGSKKVPFEMLLSVNNKASAQRGQSSLTAPDLRSVSGLVNDALFHMAKLRLAREAGRLGLTGRMADIAIFSFTRSLKCQDERDKVYAILPSFQDIHPDAGPPPEPDYTLTLSEVSRRAAIYVLQTKGGFNSLILAGVGGDSHEPSWIPQFSSQKQRSHLYEEAFSYRAAGESKPKFSFSNSGKHLVVSGVFVDSIASTQSPCTSDAFLAKSWQERQSSIPQLFSEWIEKLAQITFPDSQDRPYTAGGSTLDAINACLVQEKAFDLSPQLPKLDFLGFRTGDCKPPEFSYWEQPTRSIWIRSGHSSIFSTESGYIGSADSNPLSGDAVVIVQGLSVPLILRPATNKLWRLIGPCYVAGVMKGELESANYVDFETY